MGKCALDDVEHLSYDKAKAIATQMSLHGANPSEIILINIGYASVC